MQFKEEMLRKRYEEETGSLAEERAKQEAEEHRALMAWNDQENERLRKIRWAKFTIQYTQRDKLWTCRNPYLNSSVCSFALLSEEADL